MTEAHPLRCETCKEYPCANILGASKTNSNESLSISIRELFKGFASKVGCASHSSAKESSDAGLEPIRMNSTDIMLLAHDEWKRREERKHNHPEEHWVPGFINGFLTDRKWGREYVKKLRQQERG